MQDMATGDDPSSRSVSVREISDALLQLIATFDQVDGAPRGFGTEAPLSHLDIHLLQHVADRPQDNASAIAQKFGVTRGAVSQHVAWLRSEGLLEPAEQPSRGRSLKLVLTDGGRRAVVGHERLHERYSVLAGNLLLTAAAAEKKRLLEFLRGFDEGMSRLGEKEGL